MAGDDAVWIPILPSFKDFTKNLDQGTKGAGTAVGERVGREIAAGVDKSKAAVERASATAEKAHNRVADAAGKVRVSEEQLARARESGDSVKVARAEEQLAANRRKLGEATTSAEQADRKLADSKRGLSAAQDAATKATNEHERSVRVNAMSSEEAAQATSRFEEANKLLGVTLLATGAGLAVAGKGLYELGSQFDDMYDSIRIGTGASGAAFEGLQQAALNVANTVPAMEGGLSQIGTTMADLNTRLGATGPTLETLTGQFVQLQNMGVDADINSVSQALSGFGVKAGEAPAAMDELFQISQATGLSITQLADSAVKGGPQLRQFGFDMADSAALIGSLDKAGLDADKTIAGMSRAMVAFAKDGRDPKKALWETVVEIERFTTAGNDVAALDLAGKMFGTRGAGQFVDAVKSGQLAVDDFVSATGASSDTILGVAGETADFAEQWQLFKQMLAVELAPVAERVFGLVGDSMTWIRDNAVPGAQAFVQTLRDWSGPLLTAGILVGSLAAGMYAYTAAQAVAAAGGFLAFLRNLTMVTRLQAAAQFLLNGAMWASPITWIVAGIALLVGGFVLLWNKSDAFRNFWIGLWDGIKGAVAWAWNSVIKPAWDGIKAGWDLLVHGFSWAWSNVLKPVFDFLGLAARVVAGVLLTVLITPAIIAWNLLSTALSWAWATIIKPVFDGLAFVAKWLWNTVLMPVFGWIRAGFSAVGSLISWVWTNVIKAAWDGWMIMANWLWANVLSPVFGWIKTGFDAVGAGISWVWQNVIRPAWDALGAGISWVWNNVVSPVFEALKRGVDLVGQAFQKAVDFIGQMWDRIKGITARPVKFVIDTVYNNGIRAVWNKVAGWVGLDELPEWRPDWLGAYSRGTSVLPGYSPGRDNMLFTSNDGRAQIALGGGEGIARPEVVRAMGPGAFNALNESARRGGTRAVQRQLGEGAAFSRGGIVNLGAFAKGGTLADAAIERVFQIMRREHGKPYQYGGVGNPSWDCSGLWSGIYQELTGGSMFGGRVFNTESDFNSFGFTDGATGRVTIGVMRGGGGPNSHMAGTIDGTNIESGGSGGVQLGGSAMGTADFPLKWTLAELGGKFVEGVRGAGGGGNVIGSLVRQAFDSILKPIVDRIPVGPGVYGGMAKALGQKVSDSVRDFILSKIPGGGSGGVDISGINGPVVDVFRQVFERFGWSGAQWDAAKWIYTKESNFVPTATNPSSGAFGVPQFLGGTLTTYLPSRSTDPATQAEAGARYIRDRYGNPIAAKAFWEANGWYDQGGVLAEGITIAHNESGKPEAILTNQQWKDVSALVHELQFLTPEMKRWVDEGLVELERFANAAEKGFNSWAAASEKQGRMGSPEEFARHYGTAYGLDQADGLLGMVGLGGLVGGQLNEHTKGLLHAMVDGPVGGGADILDDNGRVIGTQLTTNTGAGALDATAPATADNPVPVVPVDDAAVSLDAQPSPAGTQVTVTLPAGKTAYTDEEVKSLLDELDQRVDDLEIKVDESDNAPAPLGAGVAGIV